MRLESMWTIARHDDTIIEKTKLQYSISVVVASQTTKSLSIIAIILELVLGDVGNKYQIMNRASLNTITYTYLQIIIEMACYI